MQLKCRIVKEIMSTCLVETNDVFLPSIRQDLLRRGVGLDHVRFALISRRNYIFR